MSSTRQPKGLYVLGFTEVFERLSYYTLSYLLVLYASDSVAKGGLGWTKEDALKLMGYYTLAAFALPVVGGFLADKFLGTFRAAILGAILIICGHALMLFVEASRIEYFYGALALVASGTAFFKPSMPTLLGRLYKAKDEQRTGGFNLYYMGINIGAMTAGFSSGLLLQHFGYHIALASAGVGMLLGLIVFLAGQKYLVTDSQVAKLGPAAALHGPALELSPMHRKALGFLAISFVFYFIWAIVYNLVISGTLSVYIQNYTDKVVFGYDIPTPFFSSLEAIAIVIAAPLLTFLMTKCAKRDRPIHFFTLMSWAVFLGFLAVGYFTYLTHVAQANITEGAHPFSVFGISIFIIVVGVSEVLISPVMMSAISLLSPLKYRTFFQALYLLVIGVTGVVASQLGAISLHHPYQTYLTLTLVVCIAYALFALLRKRMVTVAMKAAQEMA